MQQRNHENGSKSFWSSRPAKDRKRGSLSTDEGSRWSIQGRFNKSVELKTRWRNESSVGWIERKVKWDGWASFTGWNEEWRNGWVDWLIKQKRKTRFLEEITWRCKENRPFYTDCFQNTGFLVVNHNEEMFVAIWKKYPFTIFFKDRKFHLSHVLPAPATFLIFEKFTRTYFYK